MTTPVLIPGKLVIQNEASGTMEQILAKIDASNALKARTELSEHVKLKHLQGSRPINPQYTPVSSLVVADGGYPSIFAVVWPREQPGFLSPNSTTGLQMTTLIYA